MSALMLTQIRFSGTNLMKPHVSLQEEDAHYFTYRDLNRTTVSLVLARSLEDLVDSPNPQNVLKFKVVCDYDYEEDVVSEVM